MKGIFQLILVAAPLAALVLFFSLRHNNEIKVEQRLQKVQQELQEQQFDELFDQAWGVKPRSDRAQKIEALNHEVAVAKAKLAEEDLLHEDEMDDMRKAIREEDSLAQTKIQGGDDVHQK